MRTQQVILHGQIRPDGTLQIEEKINLAARAGICHRARSACQRHGNEP